MVGAPLAAQLGVHAGDGLLLRVGSGQDIPGESLYGRRDAATRTIRLTCTGVAGPDELGEFALRPGQGCRLLALRAARAAAARAPAAGWREHDSHLQHVAGRPDAPVATVAAGAHHTRGCRNPFADAHVRAGSRRRKYAHPGGRCDRHGGVRDGERGRPAGVRRVRVPRQRDSGARTRDSLQRRSPRWISARARWATCELVAGAPMPAVGRRRARFHLAQRVGLAGSRDPDRRPRRRGLLPLGRGLRTGHAHGPVHSRGSRVHRRRSGRVVRSRGAGSQRRAEPARTGTRRFRSTLVGFARRTRSTGSAFEERRRPSSPCPPDRRCGKAASAG